MLDEFFEVIMVVNLPRRTDRREHIKTQAAEFNFQKYIIFPAYDGTTLTTKPGLPPNLSWSTISMGNYGNVLSQHACISLAKDSGADSLLIIEDDCQFRDIQRLEEYLDIVPRNWDMIYFGGNHQEPLVPINDKIGKCKFTLTAHAVAMKRSIFDHMLHFTQEAYMPIDLYYAYLQKQYNVYCPLVGLATQINGYSDIESKEVDYSAIIH